MGNQDPNKNRITGTLFGTFIGDALAMPVHWYYDCQALREDYGIVTDYQAPQATHRNSIMYRSHFSPPNEKAAILHDTAYLWGRAGVHYHGGLAAGENTLNLQLAHLLLRMLTKTGAYRAEAYLEKYIRFMLTPGSHRDIYIEECHRAFFLNYARGKKPLKCGVIDNHIGGLASVPIIVGVTKDDLASTRQTVQQHVTLTHQDPTLLRAADRLTTILWQVIRGKPLRESIETIGNDFFSARRARQYEAKPDNAVVERIFGQTCYIDQSFPATLYLAWKYADRFREGLVANTNAGGDNCHRGAVLGALLGAANGINSIPSSWIDGLKLGSELKRLYSPAP